MTIIESNNIGSHINLQNIFARPSKTTKAAIEAIKDLNPVNGAARAIQQVSHVVGSITSQATKLFSTIFKVSTTKHPVKNSLKQTSAQINQLKEYVGKRIEQLSANLQKTVNEKIESTLKHPEFQQFLPYLEREAENFLDSLERNPEDQGKINTDDSLQAIVDNKIESMLASEIIQNFIPYARSEVKHLMQALTRQT